MKEAGHLLVARGHRTSTARLTAVANDECYVGFGWMPVPAADSKIAKAAAVFLNSIPGRSQLMRNAGRTLDFPQYYPAA